VVWLKLLHVSAVIVWSGALLYLLLALAHVDAEPRWAERYLLRGLFTHVATPFALLAIVSGSALFLLQGPLALWLLAKLLLVSLLVLVHGTAGMLVLRGERRIGAAHADASLAVRIATGGALWSAVLLLGGIATLVLHQPPW
jgi:uncharacterized membrane protein